MSNVQPDHWSTHPPSISSYIAIPAPHPVVCSDKSNYSSPVCGLGWKFDFSRDSHFEVSKSNADLQERRSRITATFKSNLSSGMQFKDLVITVKVDFNGSKPGGPCSAPKVFNNPSISQDLEIGTYNEPFPLREKTVFEITVTFNSKDQLSFPTSASSRLLQALATSLDGQILLDTKFYLFSGKFSGQVGRPRAVYGNATLLTGVSTYLRDCEFPLCVIPPVYFDGRHSTFWLQLS